MRPMGPPVPVAVQRASVVRWGTALQRAGYCSPRLTAVGDQRSLALLSLPLQSSQHEAVVLTSR